MSETLEIGQRVKCLDNFGTISKIKERYSPVADCVKTFVTICWDSEGEMDHDLSEFKRHGGPINEFEPKKFILFHDKIGVSVVEKEKAPSDAINKIELNEFDVRRLIASCQVALSNAGLFWN